MNLEKEIQEGFQKLVERPVTTFVAEVVSVDKEKGTCLVKDDQIDYKARLSAVVNDSNDKFYLFPKVGSLVLVAPIEEDIHQLHVIEYDEVEELNLKIGGCEFSIDKNGMNFKKNNESLKSLLLELTGAIKNLKFTTTSGSTINMLNLADFLIIENKFKTLLKDI